jgi:endogenous inhibitor of DNA gyrase (YacG/DUF329 family)
VSTAEHLCRTCGKPAPLDASNPARPFCSARCKWVDLGRWFDGTYRVPDDDEGDLGDLQRTEGDGLEPDHD